MTKCKKLNIRPFPWTYSIIILTITISLVTCQNTKKLESTNSKHPFNDYIFPPKVDSALYELFSFYEISNKTHDITDNLYIVFPIDSNRLSDTFYTTVEILNLKNISKREFRVDSKGVVNIYDRIYNKSLSLVKSTNRYAVISSKYKIRLITEYEMTHSGTGSRQYNIYKQYLFDDTPFILKYHQKNEKDQDIVIKTTWKFTYKNDTLHLNHNKEIHNEFNGFTIKVLKYPDSNKNKK